MNKICSIGMVRDSIPTLLNMIEYLKKYLPKTKVVAA